MTKTSKTVVFFGTEEYSQPALQQLIEAGYNIAAVITKPDNKRGRGHKILPPPIKVLAQKNNIPVWQPEKIADINDKIKALNQPVVGVLVGFGKIIPQSTIDLFFPGIINVHPSLLPLYRGASPIESAITNGDMTTGVSIMKIVQKMDAGPIYDQLKVCLSGQETRPELYNTLFNLGAKKLVQLLPSIIDQQLQPLDQDDSKATFCKTFSKQDAWPDFAKFTADQAERIVRAHIGYPKTKTVIFDNEITILKSHASDDRQSPLDIACQDGRFLSIDELIAPSGKTIKSNDFLNGYRIK